MRRVLTADRGDAGRRLDLMLRRHLTDVANATRTQIQLWIETGQVAVNGIAVRRAAARAALGDIVTVALPAAVARRAVDAEDINLDVLYEDDHLLALNKPAGVIVHPTYGHANGTILNALLWRARGWPSTQRPSLVGRLDKLTSGLLVVAKTAAVHAALQRSDASGGTEKDYLAMVYGRVNVARGEIDLRIGHEPRDRRRIVASATIGAPSLTRFERLARVRAPRAGLSLLRCRLATGRTHQIRVHLAAGGGARGGATPSRAPRGAPLVGDPTYGEPRWSQIVDSTLAATLRAFPRQALHAWRVALSHPITHERLRVEAPLPQDFESLLTAAGLR